MDINGKIVLLVEDEALLALTTTNTLEKYGLKVVHAINDAEAIQIVKTRNDIDLVLMDLNLGEGPNGIQIAEEVTKIKEIPIVFMSSHTEKNIIESTEEVTIYGYIVKSSSPAVILSSIKMAFKLYAATQELKKNVKAKESAFNNLKTLIENTPAAVAMFDNEMNYMIVSKQFYKDYKIKQKDIVGKNHYELFPEIDDRIKAIHKQALNGEIIISDVEKFIRNNGEIDYVKWEIQPWYNDKNEVGGVVLFSLVLNEFLNHMI